MTLAATAFELMAKIGIDASEFESGLNKAQSGISAFSVAIGNLISKGVTTAVNGLKNFGASTIDVGKGFDVAMSQLGATMGKTVDQIGDLQVKAQEMGATTKFTATEAAEGLNILAMAGLSSTEAIAGIDTVLNLASAGAMSLEAAASYTTGAVKGFGDSMDNATKYADIMAKGATMANTDVAGLGEALSGVAANARNYGQDVEGTTVALLRLAEANVTGSNASTALNAAMANLYTPTDQAKKALNELGIATYDENGKARDFNTICDEMNQKLSEYSEEQANAYKKTIFGQLGLNAYNKIVSVSVDKEKQFKEGLQNSGAEFVQYEGKLYSIQDALDKFGDKIYTDNAFTILGSAAGQAQIQLDNLEGDLTLFGSATDGLMLSIYNSIQNVARNAVQGLTNSVTNLTDKVTAYFQRNTVQEKLDKVNGAIQKVINKIVDNLDPILDGIIGLIDKLIDVVGFLVDHFEEIVTVVGLVVGAFTTMKTAMAALNFAQLLISPAGLAVVGITALIAILKACGVTMDDVKAVFQKAWNAIKTAWGAAQPFFSALINAIKSLFNAVAPVITNAFKNAWNEIKNVWNLVKPFFETLINGIKAIFQAVSPFLSAAFKSAWTAIKAVWDVAVSFFRTIWEGIKTVFAVVKGVLTGDFSDAWNGIKNVWNAAGAFFSSIWNAIKAVFSVVPTLLSGFFKTAWETVKLVWNAATAFFKNIASGVGQAFSGVTNVVGGAFRSAWSAVTSAWSNVGSFFSGVVSTISKSFSSLKSQAMTWGSDMINGFKQGIEKAKSALKGAAEGVASMVKGIFHFSRPDEGPLRDYEQWMPDFMKGMAKGIDDNIWRLRKASYSAAEAISGGITGEVTAAASGNGYGAQEVGGTVINLTINGAQYNNEQSLAEAISYELQNIMNRRRAVFA